MLLSRMHHVHADLLCQGLHCRGGASGGAPPCIDVYVFTGLLEQLQALTYELAHELGHVMGEPALDAGLQLAACTCGLHACAPVRGSQQTACTRGVPPGGVLLLLGTSCALTAARLSAPLLRCAALHHRQRFASHAAQSELIKLGSSAAGLAAAAWQDARLRRVAAAEKGRHWLQCWLRGSTLREAKERSEASKAVVESVRLAQLMLHVAAHYASLYFSRAPERAADMLALRIAAAAGERGGC